MPKVIRLRYARRYAHDHVDPPPGKWNVRHAEILEDAHVRIPSWDGVHDAEFDWLEISKVTGLTQAFFAIERKDRQGNVWKTSARCVVRNDKAEIDEIYPPVLVPKKRKGASR